MKKILILLSVLNILLCSCGSGNEDELTDYATLLTKHEWYSNHNIKYPIRFYKNHMWVFSIGSSSHISSGALTDGSYTSVGRWDVSGSTLVMHFTVATDLDAKSCPYVWPEYPLNDYNEEYKTFMDGEAWGLTKLRPVGSDDYTSSDTFDKALTGRWKTENPYKIGATGETVSIAVSMDGKGNASFSKIDASGKIIGETTSTYTSNAGVVTFADFCGYGKRSFVYLRDNMEMQFYESQRYLSTSFKWRKNG